MKNKRDWVRYMVSVHAFDVIQVAAERDEVLDKAWTRIRSRVETRIGDFGVYDELKEVLR